MTGLQTFFLIYFGVWLLPIIYGLSSNFYHRTIRPALIPQAEITILAQQLIVKHGINALAHARKQQDQAFAASNRYEQGKWQRVGRKISALTNAQNLR